MDKGIKVVVVGVLFLLSIAIGNIVLGIKACDGFQLELEKEGIKVTHAIVDASSIEVQLSKQEFLNFIIERDVQEVYRAKGIRFLFYIYHEGIYYSYTPWL